MKSDTTNTAPDVRFRSMQAGHYVTFLCPCCAKKKEALGRRLQRVQGVRQWVCRGCAK
jgi:iron only hydrogenase large subunit-like protein